MSKPGTVLIQEGAHEVRVFVNDTQVMKNRGEAVDWKGLYMAAMRSIGANVVHERGFFEVETHEFFPNKCQCHG